MAVAGENYAWVTFSVERHAFSSFDQRLFFFRHITEVKEKHSLTVGFEYNGRQNSNKEYRPPRNSLWTAINSLMGGELIWLQTSARYILYARKA